MPLLANLEELTVKRIPTLDLVRDLLLACQTESTKLTKLSLRNYEWYADEGRECKVQPQDICKLISTLPLVSLEVDSSIYHPSLFNGPIVETLQDCKLPLFRLKGDSDPSLSDSSPGSDVSTLANCKQLKSLLIKECFTHDSKTLYYPVVKDLPKLEELTVSVSLMENNWCQGHRDPSEMDEAKLEDALRLMSIPTLKQLITPTRWQYFKPRITEATGASIVGPCYTSNYWVSEYILTNRRNICLQTLPKSVDTGLQTLPKSVDMLVLVSSIG